jgi:hypothetical protein
MISKAGGPLREPLRPGQCLVLVRRRPAVRARSTDFVVENVYFKLVDYEEIPIDDPHCQPRRKTIYMIDGAINAFHSNAYVLNCTFEWDKNQGYDISCFEANIYFEGAMPWQLEF